MFMAAKELPLPIEYSLPALGGGLPTSRRPTLPTAPSSSSTAATSTACRLGSARPRVQRRHQHRPPPRQHPLRRHQPGRVRRPPARPEIVYDLALLLGVELTPEIASRALRRSDHRHRQIQVREHEGPHPPGGRRPDRRRGRRRRHLPPPLRERADREAAAGLARPRWNLQPTATANSRSATS